MLNILFTMASIETDNSLGGNPNRNIFNNILSYLWKNKVSVDQIG